MLYLVPTPIGNLEDITLRAIKVLQSVDLVLAEDTRTTGMLLKHLAIKRPLASFHIHNEHQRLGAYVAQMVAGQQVALVSDAGTPAISDPGFLLVREALKAGVEVQCLPGPTAFVPGLVVSGLPTDRFLFEGFLPQKKGRQTSLKKIAENDCTTVLYESPHRIVKLLEELKAIGLEERQIAVSREISKMFEQTVRGTVGEVLAHFVANGPKGEFVVCLAAK